MMPAKLSKHENIVFRDGGVVDLAKLRRGDERQWQTLTASLTPLLMAVAVKCLSWHESQDCVQVTLAKLVKKVMGGQCDHQVSRFAMHLLKGELIDQRRKNGRSNAREVDIEGDADGLSEPDKQAEISEMVIFAEEHVALKMALRKMDSPIREIIEERFFLGTKFQDLSVKYKMPIATLSYKIEKAIKALKESLTHLDR